MIRSRAVKITGEEEVFEGDSLFQIKSGNHWKNVGHFEHLGFIGGPPGSMKSTLLRYIAASGKPGFTPFGFRLNLGGQRISWFDGEQPRDIVVESFKHIQGMADIDFLDMYELNGIQSAVGRRREMFRIFREDLDVRKNTGLIIIDGLSNFVRNINNFDEVEDVMDKLNTSAKRLKCMILVLSHLANTEGGGKKLFGAGGTRLSQLASWGLEMSIQDKYFIMNIVKGRYGYVAPKYFEFDKRKNVLLELPYCPF